MILVGIIKDWIKPIAVSVVVLIVVVFVSAYALFALSSGFLSDNIIMLRAVDEILAFTVIAAVLILYSSSDARYGKYLKSYIGFYLIFTLSKIVYPLMNWDTSLTTALEVGYHPPVFDLLVCFLLCYTLFAFKSRGKIFRKFNILILDLLLAFLIVDIPYSNYLNGVVSEINTLNYNGDLSEVEALKTGREISTIELQNRIDFKTYLDGFASFENWPAYNQIMDSLDIYDYYSIQKQLIISAVPYILSPEQREIMSLSHYDPLEKYFKSYRYFEFPLLPEKKNIKVRKSDLKTFIVENRL